jgi:hypothetical protein
MVISHGWCRKREEKEKEVERLLLDKENQVLEASIKLSNAEQNKFNLGQSQKRLGMMIPRGRIFNVGVQFLEYLVNLRDSVMRFSVFYESSSPSP